MQGIIAVIFRANSNASTIGYFEFELFCSLKLVEFESIYFLILILFFILYYSVDN